MKKFFAISLAIVMILSLSITAFAATVNVLNGATSQDITANYNPSDNTSKKIYGANITWDDISVTYSYGKDWNPNTLDYDVDAEGSWTGANDIKVTVENRSNASIWAKVEFEGANGVTAASITEAAEIEAATKGAANGTKMQFTITVEGEPTDLEETAIGTATVTLADAAFES